MKGLGGDRQRIAVAPLGEQRLRLGRGKSGHDPVDERVEEEVARFDPGGECGLEAPSRGMGENDAPKRRAVRFDQLAGKKDEPGRLGAAERVEARLQKSRRLGREALRADRGIVGLGDLDDAGLGRVGDDEAQIRASPRFSASRASGGAGRAWLDRADDAAVLDVAAVERPRSSTVKRLSCVGSAGGSRRGRARRIATPPSKTPFSLATSIIQSTKPRRNTPSPICRMRTGLGRSRRAARLWRRWRARSGSASSSAAPPIRACRPTSRGGRRDRARPRTPRRARADVRRRAGRERRSRRGGSCRGAPGSTGRRACRR